MNEMQQPRRVLRSIGAVLAALFAVIVLSIGTDVVLHATGVFPPLGQRIADPLLLLATGYRSVYAVAGSYIAARLAPAGGEEGRPMRHALALGAVGMALGIVGAAATWNAGPAFEPKWYPVALIVIAMPCAWIGGLCSGLHGAHRRTRADRHRR